MCQCNSVIRPSEEAKKIICILKVLFFVYLVLIVLQLVFGNFGNAISGIIIILLLLMTFMQCFYMLAGYLIFIVAFSAFNSIVFIGQRTQNKIAGLPDKFLMNGFYIAVLVTECVAFIFYVILIYYSFQAYKEFKACLLFGSSGGYTELSGSDIENSGPANNDNGRAANTNRGIATNPATINNTSLSSNNPPQATTSFKAFTGKGYTVGDAGDN